MGREPRRWIEGVGIPWDETAKRLATEAVEDASKRGPDPTSGIVARIRRADATAGDPIEIGVVDLQPFSDPLDPRGESYFQRVAAQMIGALAPGLPVRFRPAAPGELVEALLDPDDPLELAIGLLAAARLQALGLEFLPLPGWELATTALWVQARDTFDLPNWSELGERLRAGEAYAVVPAHDPAVAQVFSRWRTPSEHGTMVRRATPKALEDAVMTAEQDRPTVLVADEETVRRVGKSLLGNQEFVLTHILTVIRTDETHLPRAELAIAYRADAREWGRLLCGARRELLQGAGRSESARDLGDLLFRSVELLPADVRPTAEAVAGNLRPRSFPEADPAFRRVVAERLVARLADLHFASPGRSRSSEAEWTVPVQSAYAVFPREWRATLDEVAWEHVRAAVSGDALPVRPFLNFCHSCSASLHEYGSSAEQYCSACTDREGQLRSRDDVERVLAGWMSVWQGGLPLEEALDRARRYMSAMPAWSRN